MKSFFQGFLDGFIGFWEDMIPSAQQFGHLCALLVWVAIFAAAIVIFAGVMLVLITLISQAH